MTQTIPDLFDAAYYVGQLPPEARPEGLAAAWQHYRRHPFLADPSPYFDNRHYCARYPDWADHGAKSPLVDFLHRLERGQERQSHPLIDLDFYRQQIPGLSPSDSALLHFIRHGDAENRAPSQDFDAGFYTRCYLPLQATHAFAHYVRQGRAAGYLPRRHAFGAQDVAEFLGQKPPFDIVLVGHDAQEAGGPIVLLTGLRALRARGLRVLVLLQRAGPLLEAYRACAPVMILDEGWPVEAVLNALPGTLPIVTNTVVTLPIAQRAHEMGRPTLALIQELPMTIHDAEMAPICEAAARTGLRMGFSHRFIRDRFNGLLSAPLPEEQAPILGFAASFPPPSKAEVKAIKEQMRGRRPAVIGAGHADYRKGFDLFLEAAWSIHRRKKKAHFYWLGALNPWAQGLADQALAEGLPLILPGHVPSVSAWFSAGDLFMLTSRSDAGPATLQAALMVGCPCVGFGDEIGLAEDLHRFGTAIAGTDPEALADAAIANWRQRLSPDDVAALNKRYDFEPSLTRILDAIPQPG